MITDSFHIKKLKQYGLDIKTKYIVGHKILERNTDGTINDDITNGIRCEKQYYKNNKLIHKEKLFDSRIEYTFISNNMEEKEHKYDVEAHAKRLESILSQWDALKALMQEELPSYEELDSLAKRIGLDQYTLPIEDALYPDMIRATKDIRDKYVLPRLCWDLGIIDEII